MDKIAIAKTEYRQLRRQASAYKKLAQNLHELLLRDSAGFPMRIRGASERPCEGFCEALRNRISTRCTAPVGRVVADFRKTGLYDEDFLSDLETGLRKSSYAKKR